MGEIEAKGNRENGREGDRSGQERRVEGRPGEASGDQASSWGGTYPAQVAPGGGRRWLRRQGLLQISWKCSDFKSPWGAMASDVPASSPLLVQTAHPEIEAPPASCVGFFLLVLCYLECSGAVTKLPAEWR